MGGFPLRFNLSSTLRGCPVGLGQSSPPNGAEVIAVPAGLPALPLVARTRSEAEA